MQVLKKYILYTSCILSVLYAQAVVAQIPEDTAPVVDQSQTQLLNNLLDRYYVFHMVEIPELGMFYGYPGQSESWTDMSEAGYARRNTLLAEMLDDAYGIDRASLSEDDKLYYDVLKWSLEDYRNWSRFHMEYAPLNQLDSVHDNIGYILNAMPANTVADYVALLVKMKKAPLLIEQNIELMRKGLKAGMTPPKVTLSGVPDQICNLLADDVSTSYYYIPFTKLPATFTPEEAAYFQSEAASILRFEIYPALRNLQTFLVDEYIPNCRESLAITEWPEGQAIYQQSIKSLTTTDLTPHAIHQIGLQEVARIHGEMQGIVDELDFEGSLKDFFNFLRSDPRFFYQERHELIQGYRDILKKVEGELPRLFGTLPKTPYEVVPVPEFKEEQAVAAYYSFGSLKEGRPGRFYANTSRLNSRPKWEMEALALHEALPGHHMQLSLALEKENVPRFCRLAHFTAYIEGWGLYSESLGSELGLYKNPYSRFGGLCAEIFRAVRLVVDTGIHSYGWSRQQAIDYFVANTGLSLHDIKTEVDRYIVWPGQALAYKVGELKIKELRSYAQNILGDAFDIRAFHDEVLRTGALPLAVFEARIKDWVKSVNTDATQGCIRS